MAYWNLHERQLAQDAAGALSVTGPSGVHPLTFFHFSGIDPRDLKALSKHQSRFTLADREDLVALFERYAQRLLENGYASYKTEPYGFGSFQTGERVTVALRRYYAECASLESDPDPFAEGSSVHRFARRHRLIPKGNDDSSRLTSLNVDASASWKLSIMGRLLRMTSYLLGPRRYALLSKFMRYYGIFNNQAKIMF
jgi:hypothetical protein